MVCPSPVLSSTFRRRPHLLARATVKDSFLSLGVDGQRLGVVRSLDLLGEPLALGVRYSSQAMPGRASLGLDVMRKDSEWTQNMQTARRSRSLAGDALSILQGGAVSCIQELS